MFDGYEKSSANARMTIVETVDDVCVLAAGMMMGRQRRRQEERRGPYRCDVSRRHGRW